MKTRVTKAILPVAGLGTRFLPATKSIPKEILTLVDKPLVQYAIEEGRAAGIEQFIFVTARGKSALEDFFDTAPQLEESLLAKGKHDLLDQLQATNMKACDAVFIRQHEALGLGHAIGCARRLIDDDEPFAVILPDDVVAAETPCLRQMVDAYAETGGQMLAAMDVPREKTKDYGILDVDGTRGRLSRVRGMVEKPDPADAPSTLAVIGRYILTPRIFDHLENQQPGAGGEIQITDAIAREIAASGVHGFRFEGERFDCGSKAGFLQATLSFGLEREDLRDELSDYLRAKYDYRLAAE